jgi:hypothetical protein
MRACPFAFRYVDPLNGGQILSHLKDENWSIGEKVMLGSDAISVGQEGASRTTITVAR